LASAQVLELAQAACHSSTATELEANENKSGAFSHLVICTTSLNIIKH